MHVSGFSIVFMLISALISIGLPIVIFIFLRKKYNAKYFPMIIGVAAFILFALIMESSIHYFVFKIFAIREKPLIYILYGSLMAGIFEETARFISFNLLKKKEYTGIGTGLSYGIGHGGIEAILLVGVSVITSIVFCVIINTGNMELLTGKLQGGALERTNLQINILVNMAPYMFLVSGIERLFAITIQMSLSVIMFFSVYCKGKIWLFPFAILLHAIFDLSTAMYQVGVIKSLFLVEGIVCLCTVGVMILAINVYKRLKDNL